MLDLNAIRERLEQPGIDTLIEDACDMLEALGQVPYPDIRAERERQDTKWGVQNHSPLYWLAILGEEFGEAAKAAIEGRIAYMRTELIHVAAVAVAAIESLDRNELRGLPADVPTDEEWYAGKDALWQERHDREADFARRIAD